MGLKLKVLVCMKLRFFVDMRLGVEEKKTTAY